MSILFDPRGNEFFGQLDSITGQTVTDARNPTATLAALNAESVVDLNGHATLMVDVRGTFVGTLVFEGTIDGSNYFALPAYSIAAGAYIAGVTIATQIALNCAGYKRLRARCSAYTSGSILVTLRATTADFTSIVERIPATSAVTVTAAVSVAATLTLPAPGAGLYQYVDWIRIEHFATALLTAGATPVIVTSTNMPGTPSHNFRADAAPQGTLTEKTISNNMPVRAVTANTAVTVICPATTGVIWRATASYRVGA